MRFSIPFLCLILIGTFTQGGAADPIRVGIRHDAKPFVYREAGEPKGFLFDLCKAVLDTSGLGYTLVDVNAANRLSWLGDEDRIDLLCDPVTVTLDRAARFQFSPIVFVSGGSFLHFDDKEQNDAIYLAGLARIEQAAADGTLTDFAGRRLVPAKNGIVTYENGDPPGADAHQIKVAPCHGIEESGRIGTIRIGVLDGSTAPEIINNALRSGRSVIPRSGWDTVCYKVFETHQTGIAALCSREPDSSGVPLSYYFGDRDIILSYLDTLRTDGAVDCGPVAVSDRFFSVEPYAMVYSDRVAPAEIKILQKALLETFSAVRETTTPTGTPWRTTLPFELFARYFPGKDPSPSLITLFKSMIVPER